MKSYSDQIPVKTTFSKTSGQPMLRMGSWGGKQCQSTPDPQDNPNFTFKVSVDRPPQDQCQSTPDPQGNPNFTFKVSVDRPPQDQCRSTLYLQGNPNFTF